MREPWVMAPAKETGRARRDGSTRRVDGGRGRRAVVEEIGRSGEPARVDIDPWGAFFEDFWRQAAEGGGADRPGNGRERGADGRGSRPLPMLSKAWTAAEGPDPGLIASAGDEYSFPETAAGSVHFDAQLVECAQAEKAPRQQLSQIWTEGCLHHGDIADYTPSRVMIITPKSLSDPHTNLYPSALLLFHEQIAKAGAYV